MYSQNSAVCRRRDFWPAGNRPRGERRDEAWAGWPELQAIATADGAGTIAAALTALSADLDALKALIAADAGVTAAQAKLTADLPTVAAAQTTVQADYTTLTKHLAAALGGRST